MPDDEDRPRDASSAAGAGWSDADHATWSDEAPDDISELADDIAAYHRERRAQRRRAVMHRLLSRVPAVPVSLSVAVLAVVVLVAGVLTFISPGTSSPSRAPLATPTVAAGQQGGLLPQVAVEDLTGTPVQVQSLRPAVIALIPAGFADVSLLASLADSAAAARLSLVVVAPGQPNATATALAGRIDSGATKVYYDADGRLASDFAASGLSVVLVNRDGTVSAIRRAVSADSQVTPLLQQMLQRTSG